MESMTKSPPIEEHFFWKSLENSNTKFNAPEPTKNVFYDNKIKALEEKIQKLFEHVNMLESRLNSSINVSTFPLELSHRLVENDSQRNDFINRAVNRK